VDVHRNWSLTSFGFGIRHKQPDYGSRLHLDKRAEMVRPRPRGRDLRGLMRAVECWVGLGRYFVLYNFCWEGSVKGSGEKHRGSGIWLDRDWKAQPIG